ncbi:hypothetical protein ACQKP0_02770 [Heyndrickxia sp. NPDC080065]|uniref:hypothetical protein n=1 Tax=Heyndrickxia sp. NPDC080065 TaxID=3390568 RepID=UPI003D038CF8
MKKTFGLLLLFVAFISIVACSNKEVVKQDDVLNFVKDYKSKQYTIKDPSNDQAGNEIVEKVKAFLSEDTLNKMMANRAFDLIPYIAKNMNKSIELQEINLEKANENGNGTINYKYNLKIKFYDEQSSEMFERKGELTLSTDNGLKITRDWEETINLGTFEF